MEQRIDSVQLPYHLTIAPIGIPFGAKGEGDEEGAIFLDDEHRAKIEETLLEELDGTLFSKVTTLDLPHDSAESDIVAAAKTAGADLLLRVTSVTYEPEPDTNARNMNWFWFFTGPPTYFFDDRDYLFDVTLKIELLDLHAIQEPIETGEWLIPQSAVLEEFSPKAGWVSTKYSDRVEGGAFGYLQSIVVPTAHLDTFEPRAMAAVTEKSLQSVADDLAVDIALFAKELPGRVAELRDTDEPGQFYLHQIFKGGGVEPSLPDGQPGLGFEAWILQDEFQAGRDFAKAAVRIGGYELPLAQRGEVMDDRFAGEIELMTSVAEQGPPVSLAQPDMRWKRITGVIPVKAVLANMQYVPDTFQVVLQDEDGGRVRTRSWTFQLGDAAEPFNKRAIEAGWHVEETEAMEANLKLNGAQGS